MPKFHLDLQVEFIKFKKMKPFFYFKYSDDKNLTFSNKFYS